MRGPSGREQGQGQGQGQGTWERGRGGRRPDGTLLVVGTGPVVPGDGRGPSLTVRAPDGSERVVPLDGPHEDVTVSADGRTAYVTMGFTRDGYGNGITVVDLTGKRPPAEVHAGARPLGIAVL